MFRKRPVRSAIFWLFQELSLIRLLSLRFLRFLRLFPFKHTKRCDNQWKVTLKAWANSCSSSCVNSSTSEDADVDVCCRCISRPDPWWWLPDKDQRSTSEGSQRSKIKIWGGRDQKNLKFEPWKCVRMTRQQDKAKLDWTWISPSILSDAQAAHCPTLSGINSAKFFEKLQEL